jgi:pimeloyl-ACP methyl ester carboxylesterase
MSLGVFYEKGARESSEESCIMSHTTNINGYRIAYNQVGYGPQKAVLVHGWGASKAWWQTVAEGIAETHTCIIPDLLGFGGSSKPAEREDFRIEHQTEVLAAFIQQLNLGPVYLIGHSMGGMISVTLAHRYPELVDRLAVFNLVVTGRCGSFLRLGQLTLSLPVLGRPLYAVGQYIPKSTLTTYAQSFRPMFQRPGIFRHSEVQDFLVRTYPALRDTPMRSLEFALWAFTHFDLRPFMHEVEHPTLIICGEDDKQIPPEDSLILAQGLPNAQLECLPAAGHNPFVEYPEYCVGLLRVFAANGHGTAL